MDTIHLENLCFSPSVTLEVPSSKSVTNRLLLLAFLNEEIKLENVSTSEDSVLMQALLTQIDEQQDFMLNCKNAGTVFRFLTSLVATLPGEYILTGEDRMLQRPIAPLVDSLRNLGVKIDYLNEEGYPPLRVQGQILDRLETVIDVEKSSQFLSSLLLVSGKIKGEVTIKLEGASSVSLPYVSMTLELLKQVGIEYVWEGDLITKKDTLAKQKSENLKSTFFVETDWSSVSYVYAWVALSLNTKVFVPHLNVNSLQGDAILAEVFKDFGVHTSFTFQGAWIEKKSKASKNTFEMDFTHCPDLALTFGVLCACLQRPFIMTGLSTLQYKESARLDVLQIELLKCGVRTEKKEESVLSSISFENMSGDITIETYKDHRMAMAFSLFWCLYPQMHIANYKVVEKSFPSYWQCLEQLGVRTRKQGSVDNNF